MRRSEKNLSDKYEMAYPAPSPPLKQNKQKQGYDSCLLKMLK